MTDASAVFGIEEMRLHVVRFVRLIGELERARWRLVCRLFWHDDQFWVILPRARVAAFDTGPVNYGAAVIEHRPAETRRANLAATTLALLDPPLPEWTRVVSARLFNLKGEDVTAGYDRDQPATISIRRDYPRDVERLELTLRIPELIGQWDALFTVVQGQLPMTVLETPGGGNPYEAASKAAAAIVAAGEDPEGGAAGGGGGDNNVGNWMLVHATASAIRAIDRERGLPKRDIKFHAKKEDVPRGTPYALHKRVSVDMGFLAVADDTLFVTFMLALRRVGMDSLFDLP